MFICLAAKLYLVMPLCVIKAGAYCTINVYNFILITTTEVGIKYRKLRVKLKNKEISLFSLNNIAVLAEWEVVGLNPSRACTNGLYSKNVCWH